MTMISGLHIQPADRHEPLQNLPIGFKITVG